MKIVILAGGTGSVALQTGLHELLDRRFDGVDTKIIVNAYDNGFSTGIVRRVFGGAILGPSDVRKNQVTRLKLEKPWSPWIKFLEDRFTIATSQAKEYCLRQVANLARELGDDHDPRHVRILENAIEVFFANQLAEKIDYSDFSLANIVYAGLARQNNNSIRRAATIMAELLGIPDNVIVNDDRSLFIGARTRGGVEITDEGDIVSWGKKDDPIVDLFFTDATGNETRPVLCEEARDAILAADLIILSSGTQWSSLIPTYASDGFYEAIARSQARIIMVMNRHPDNDSPGQTASDIINTIIPLYFPKRRVHLLLDVTAHPNMSSLTPEAEGAVASVTSYPMGLDGNAYKHDPEKLSAAVARIFFKEHLDSEWFIFDYDDTLVGRGNYQPKASRLNQELIYQLNSKRAVSICTGNSVKAINISAESAALTSRPLTVYADGGINMYLYTARTSDDDDDRLPRAKFDHCAKPTAALDKDGPYSAQSIIDTLRKHGIPVSRLENRGNAVISIKPIDPEYRPAIKSLAEILLRGSGLRVSVTGRTTIDIMKPMVSKASAIEEILALGTSSITYVGDELRCGNDAPVAALEDPRVKCLQVSDPAMTAFFLTTLLSKIAHD